MTSNSNKKQLFPLLWFTLISAFIGPPRDSINNCLNFVMSAFFDPSAHFVIWMNERKIIPKLQRIQKDKPFRLDICRGVQKYVTSSGVLRSTLTPYRKHQFHSEELANYSSRFEKLQSLSWIQSFHHKSLERFRNLLSTTRSSFPEPW